MASLSAPELFDRLTEVAEVYADSPPALNEQERRLAVETARRVGAGRLLDLWSEYLASKPGKRFLFFTQDFAAEIREARPAPAPQMFKCSECGRNVPQAQFFPDTRTCYDCERKLCPPENKVGLIKALKELTSVHG